MRSILNSGFNINPVKKSFNRLASTADSGIQAITRAKGIIYRPFMRYEYINISSLLEEFCPGRVRVSTVSKQAAV